MTIKRIVRNQRITASHIQWQTVPDFDDADAGAFSEDIGQYATDLQGHTLQFSIAPTSPSDEADITAAGLSLDPDTGVLSGTYDGETELSVVVRAEDTLSLEQDFQNRVDAAGVVWYQPLSSAAEVSAFRWTLGFSSGNDPNGSGTNAANVRLITDDDGKPCMECHYPSGSSPNSCHWIRPFSALNTGSGKAVNDPADGGALTVRAWSPTSGGGQTSGWQHGYYTHSAQAGEIPGGGTRDGAEYYLQLRVKMDPERKSAAASPDNHVGKFVWFTICEDSFVPGEHVTWSYGHGGNAGFENYLRVYVATNGGTDPLNPGSRIQEGSDSATDWFYSGGWDTLLYHVRPGNAGVSSGINSTKLEIWAAHEGETSYTKIWNQEYNVSSWFRGGHNALMLTAYNNGKTFDRAFDHRYRHLIFSKQFIACPLV